MPLLWKTISGTTDLIPVKSGAGIRVDGGVLLGSGGPRIQMGSATTITAIRNGTTPQELQITETYTDSTHYGRFVIRTTSGSYTIGSEQTGGTPRGLNIQANGITAIGIDSSGNQTSSFPDVFTCNKTSGAVTALLANFQYMGSSVATIGYQGSAYFSGSITAGTGAPTASLINLASGGAWLGTTGTMLNTGLRIQANKGIFLEAGVLNSVASFIQFGTQDAASPLAQILQVQNVVAGTTNTAGAAWTFQDSIGTGNGPSGGYIWKVAPAGSSGSTQNATATALGLDSTKTLTLYGPLKLSNSAVTGLSAGALAATTNASIVLYDSTGQAYRVPCII